jgi:hypothetical protein
MALVYDLEGDLVRQGTATTEERRPSRAASCLSTGTLGHSLASGEIRSTSLAHMRSSSCWIACSACFIAARAGSPGAIGLRYETVMAPLHLLVWPAPQ